ncbi:MAG: biopolymer transporter ExbD [Spirochaetales bacterium]|nr:MAG: biopolymer transporter ExbD [Spirochaetales bacterium]
MKFQRRLSPRATVDLIPMIDVVFQLVIFFMVTSTFILTPGIGLVLPSADTAEPMAVSKLVVTLVSREEVYLNKDLYDLKGLNTALEALPQARKDEVKTVVLQADKATAYSLIVEVLDVLRRNGFKGVNLKTISEGSG